MINVLNVDTSCPSIPLSIFGAVVIAAVVFAVGALIFSADGGGAGGFVIAGIMTAIVLGLLIYIGVKNYPKQCRPRIECTISDDANFNEIFDKYEIVKQRGDIYTLVERETEKTE